MNFARSALECGESSHPFCLERFGTAITSSRYRAVNVLQKFAHAVAKFPVWIMRLKLSHIADPPDVVADAVRLLIAPGQFFAADLFAHLDGLEHGTVAVPTAADVIDLSGTRRSNEF